jgi:DNA uptake protein ComE-like DNA-binding protein
MAVSVALLVVVGASRLFPDSKTESAQSLSVLDINSASKDDLKALPGMGEEYARRVIRSRPYADKNELLTRNVLPKSVYDGVRDRVTAAHAKARPVTAAPTQ